MKNTIVPIIMQTYNRLEYTMEVIASFRNHLLYPHQVIVIDNASTDGTQDYLKLMKKLGYVDHLILNETNLGIAEPKNQGLKIVKQLAEVYEINYICITDNDIVPPFIRDEGDCILGKIIKVMEAHTNIGMCGCDLSVENAPDYQDWWWKLRQNPSYNPTFAEIVIGFWFSVFRYKIFNEFEFSSESLYGRVDESIRNWLSYNGNKIGLIKGVIGEKETIPKVGLHLGWVEDQKKYPEYVAFKKNERHKSEEAWKQKNLKW